MIDRKEFETYTESHNIPEVFSFSEKENEKQFLNENFVFKAEENKFQTGTDLNNDSTGIEENDYYRELNKQKEDDGDIKEEQKEIESQLSSENASSSAANSGTVAASNGGFFATAIATATAAVVLTIGGGIALSQAFKEPSICEFHEVASYENNVYFMLMLGTDEEKIYSGEENDETDCIIEISSSFLSYSDEIEAKNFGIISGEFNNLEYNTEYSLSVYRPTMLGADREYICDPVTVRTSAKENQYLVEITISGEYQTEFYAGDEFNYEGIEIIAHYSDGESRSIPTGDFVISTPDMSTPGEKVVVVTYSENDIEVSTSYTIMVSEIILSSLELGGEYPTEFFVDDEFSCIGLEVTAYYNNGVNRIIEDGDYVVVTPDMSFAGEKSVEVSYTENGITEKAYYVVNVITPELESIVLGGEYPTEFYTGDEFSYEGLVVTANYNNGSSRVLEDGEYTIEEPDMSTAGEKTVTIIYNETGIDITASYTITVFEPTLDSINLSGQYPTQFYVGDEFSIEGMVVTANYNNGTSKEVSYEDLEIIEPTMSTVGTQEVIINYTDGNVTKYATYDVEILSVVATSLTLSGNYQTSFYVGDEFNYEGLEITVNYNNGSSETAEENYITVNEPETMEEAGTQTVTVTYQKGADNVSTTYDITIEEIVGEELTVEVIKEEYDLEEEIDFDNDIIVTLHYNNGDTEILSINDYTYDELPDMSTPGNKTITIRYGDNLSAEFSIYVNEPAPEPSVSVNSIFSLHNCSATEFYIGFDLMVEDEGGQIDSSLILTVGEGSEAQRFVLDTNIHGILSGYYMAEPLETEDMIGSLEGQSYTISATIDNEEVVLYSGDGFAFDDYGYVPGTVDILRYETNQSFNIVIQDGQEMFGLSNYENLYVKIYEAGSTSEPIENVSIGEEIQTGLPFDPTGSRTYYYELWGTLPDGDEPVLIYSETLYV